MTLPARVVVALLILTSTRPSRADSTSSVLFGVAGGPVASGRDDCEGYFAGTPAHRILLEPGKHRLELFSDQASVLVVRDPQGHDLCGKKNELVVDVAVAGIYSIYVGARVPEVGVPYALGVTAPDVPFSALAAIRMYRAGGSPWPELDTLRLRRGDDNPDLSDVMNVIPRGKMLDIDQLRLPIKLVGQVTGKNAGTADKCEGWFDDEPTAHFAVPEESFTKAPLESYQVSVASEVKLPIKVKLSTGETLCSLTGSANGVFFHPRGAVTVDAWVGTRTKGAKERVSLWIEEHRGPGMGHGTDALAPARVEDGTGSPGRAERIKAVVRLRTQGRFLCTSTVVRRHGVMGVVTAAHCLFEHTRTGNIGPRRTSLAADGLPPLDLASAAIPGEFQACSDGGVSYADCIAGGSPDVAFVPFTVAPPETVASWRLCNAPAAEEELSAFGFGLDRGALPGKLLTGAFTVLGARTGVWPAAGHGKQEVEPGDSGGPVIVASDDRDMDATAPAVCFVVAANLRGGQDDPTGGAAQSLFQPLWQLDRILP